MAEDSQRLDQQPGFLPWEDDLEMISKYLDKKGEVEVECKDYIGRHPELRALLADFLQALLVHRPDNVLQFAQSHFLTYKRLHRTQ